MELTEKLAQLDGLQKKLYAFTCAESSLYLDSVTVAPKNTAEGRGVALSILAGERQKLLTAPETKALLDELAAEQDKLDPLHKREVELLRRECEKMTRIPAEEYMAYTELTNRASDVWHKAKENNDFASFCPILQELVDYNRKFAVYYDAEKAPYDALLNEYERGVDSKQLDSFFDTLREGIVPLIRAGVPGRPAEGFCRLSHGGHGHRPQPLRAGGDGAPLYAGVQQQGRPHHHQLRPAQCGVLHVLRPPRGRPCPV